MKVVYFPRNIGFLKGLSNGDKLNPSVGFGIVNNIDADRVCVNEYSLIEYFVDGVPENKFSTDADWNKLPVGFKKNKDYTKHRTLIESRLNNLASDEFTDFKSFSKTARLTNPNDILYAIGREWLVRSDLITGYNFDIEIDGDKYKLVRKAKDWTQTYGDKPSSYFEYTKNLYETYEEAMNASKGLIANYYIQMQEGFKLNIEDSILWILEKIPEDKKQECEFILRLLPYSRGFCLRFYEGEVLFANGGENNWRIVFSLKT